jgi:hypothetical protein
MYFIHLPLHPCVSPSVRAALYLFLRQCYAPTRITHCTFDDIMDTLTRTKAAAFALELLEQKRLQMGAERFATFVYDATQRNQYPLACAFIESFKNGLPPDEKYIALSENRGFLTDATL